VLGVANITEGFGTRNALIVGSGIYGRTEHQDASPTRVACDIEGLGRSGRLFWRCAGTLGRMRQEFSGSANQTSKSNIAQRSKLFRTCRYVDGCIGICSVIGPPRIRGRLDCQAILHCAAASSQQPSWLDQLLPILTCLLIVIHPYAFALQS